MSNPSAVEELTPVTDESSIVHAWRVERLHSLGIPARLADHVADSVDWHQIADLIRGGCDPILALRISF
jgi:hypothetical protein